jgi:hypothetical protein
MAGLADLLGTDNPFQQFVSGNRGKLGALGAGLASGRSFGSGLSNAAQMLPQGQVVDSLAEAQKAEEAKRLEMINRYATTLRGWGDEYADLAAGVEAGGIDPAQAYMTAWERRYAPKAAPDLTADMQNYQYAQANPGFADFMGGAGEAPQIVETFDPVTGQPVKGYMQGTQFVPVGGPKQASARDNPMNATIQKEIFEADEAVQAGQATMSGLTRALELNQVAYDGPFADQRSAASALFGDQGGVATQELKNVVTAQALESLKAVFGGMPTEGERKILLEIQGSVDQPKAVREAIYRRAMAAAERRMAANQAKANGLRSGEYFAPSFGQQTPGGQTSTGLQWSLEP